VLWSLAYLVVRRLFELVASAGGGEGNTQTGIGSAIELAWHAPCVSSDSSRKATKGRCPANDAVTFPVRSSSSASVSSACLSPQPLRVPSVSWLPHQPPALLTARLFDANATELPRDRGRSRIAMSAVSSSASRRSMCPTSCTVVSATSRLPCSNARRNAGGTQADMVG
jgi:hypothetical protein